MLDDCFSALTTLTTGTRWNPATRSLQWDPETDKRDREEGTNMERITMEEVAKLSSGLISGLKFTWDIPPDEGSMPVLDTMCWMGVETRVEGLNSLFQAARARARGYRTNRNFIVMIYMIASPVSQMLNIT